MPSFIWIQNVIFPLAGMGMAVLLGFGIYRTVNKIIDRKMSGGSSSKEVESLRAEMDALRAEHAVEIAELYDRIDFMEKLLNRATSEGPTRRKLTPAKSVFP
jgi:hypothetical protein